MKVLGCLAIFFIGLMVMSALIVEEVLPPWLFPICLLPVAIFLDHFFSSGTHSWKILQYSVTGGVLCLTFLGFVLMEFEEFRKYFLYVLAVAFFTPLLFAPELIFWSLGKEFPEKVAKEIAHTHEKS